MAMEEGGFIYAAPAILKGGRGYFELVEVKGPVWVPDDLPNEEVLLHGINQYFKARVLRWGNRVFIPVDDFPDDEAYEWL